MKSFLLNNYLRSFRIPGRTLVGEEGRMKHHIEIEYQPKNNNNNNELDVDHNIGIFS